MPGIAGSDRITIAAFEYDGNVYLFEVGEYKIQDLPEWDEWTSASRKNNADLISLHFRFHFRAGYLAQQLNAGAAYTLADDTDYPSVSAIGIADLLNALVAHKTTPVYFYPALQDGDDVNVATKYEVIPESGSNELLSAAKSGRFVPSMPIRFLTKNPLTSYPSWFNR